MALLDFLRRDSVNGFWAWFEKNAEEIAAEVQGLKRGSVTGRATDRLGDRLARIHPDLVHEIGIDCDGDVELIVSADGHRAAFEAVSRTVQAAPRLPGFKVTGFRRRAAPGVALGMFGREVTLDDATYEAWPEEARLGVRIFLPFDLDEAERKIMGLLLVDMALGEFDVETGLGTIAIETGAPAGAKRLSGLAAEFDAFRAPTAH